MAATSRDPGVAGDVPVSSHSPGRRKPQLQAGNADPYAVLGLERNTSQAEIRQTYFELVREYSPEKDPHSFKIIRAAYEKLRTATAQSETDLFLLQRPPAWQEARTGHATI